MSNNSDNVNADTELYKLLVEALKNNNKNATAVTIDQVLWILLFVFIFVNKIYSYYCKPNVNNNHEQHIDTSHVNNNDRNINMCEMI